MIYLDNAATALIRPDCVSKAVCSALNSLGNPGRGAHEAALNAARTVHIARHRLAKLFNAENPSSIAFTSNATEALNMAIFGLFGPGDGIITTAAEHNSVLRPLHLLSLAGAEVSYIPAGKDGVPIYSAVTSMIKANTKAVITTHASNVTGNIADLASISEICRQNGLLLIVDGAQSAGCMNVDVQGSGIDVFCFTGHKGLMGPQGTGGVYVRPGIKIRPLKSGGSGIHSYDPLHPSVMPDALEAGTLNCHGIAGLSAAADFISSEGIARISQKEAALADMLYNELCSVPNIKIYGQFGGIKRAPIISLNIDSLDSGYVCEILSEKYNIAARGGAHCAPMLHKALGTVKQGAVRLSFGYFNTVADVQAAADALRSIAARC